MGLWSTLGIGRSALEASQLALQITGHNIANASTKGYARQRVDLSANAAGGDRMGAQAGTGVDVVGVNAMVDRFLEERMRAAAGEAGDLATRHAYLSRLENVVNELRDDDLSSALSRFFNAVEDLLPNPQDMALRGVVVRRGEALAGTIVRTRGRLDDIRLEIGARIDAGVGEVNRLAREVADLNVQIIEQEHGGTTGTANDLRSRRAGLLEELSRHVATRTFETERGAVNVYLGNHMLVQDHRADSIEVTHETDRGVQISRLRMASDGSPTPINGGELAGLISARDDLLGGVVDDLDLLARSLIFEVNRVHSTGQGLTPFAAVTAGEAVSDAGAVLNAAGLAFTPVHGQFDITLVNRDSGLGTTTTINVDLDGIDPANDTTLATLAADLDAVTGVRSYVDSRNRLVVEAESDRTGMAFSNDSSGALAALGINTFFTGFDSATMAITDLVSDDPSMLAAARTGEAGDASNLSALLALRSTGVADLDGLAPGEFLETTATALASQTAAARDASSAAQIFLAALHAEREAHSGVNLDEEALNLIRFGRTFQAAARLVSTVDELLRMLMAI